ncbi:MAG TPA: hypothetical protein DIT25_03520 [Candidatus Moranbacteria bacterium]|nr:hypothetical protein [Candidatus Moranbacteria bacterium]
MGMKKRGWVMSLDARFIIYIVIGLVLFISGIFWTGPYIMTAAGFSKNISAIPVAFLQLLAVYPISRALFR